MTEDAASVPGKPADAKRRRALAILAIVALSFAVRAGTSHFLGERLGDAGWFQHGSYRVFDTRAQNIIDGVEPVFFLDDPTRTDLIQYPPGFPLLIGAIYELTGERTSHSVLRVLWIVDLILMPLLVLGTAVSAFGWRAAYAAGVFAAISPILAYYGVTPSSDAVTTWFVLGATWLLLIAARRKDLRFAIASGIVLGVACWFRVNPLFLALVWAVALAIAIGGSTKRRLGFALCLAGTTGIFIAPLAIRNIIVFNEVVLTGLSFGVNLWEGLGETEYGRSRGFKYGDQVMLEHERAEMGLPDDAPLAPFFPDGIRRDRERARQSLEVIAERPFWYAGVMATRMWFMIKIAGEPGQYYGTAGINCTPSKCLPPGLQGFPASSAVTLLGFVQSIYRYIAMPLAVVGILLGWRKNRAGSLLMLGTVFYYLVPGTFGHTELRYVMPMHAVLVIFGGLGFSSIVSFVKDRPRRSLPAPAA